MKRQLAGALALAATTTGSITLIPEVYTPSASASTLPLPADVKADLAVTFPAKPRHTVLPLIYTVAPGDTLSGLAARYCHGHANDWTGFYADNKGTIGRNPNLILPGQQLGLLRCTDPPELLHLGSTYHAPVRVQAPAHAHQVTTFHHRGGKVWHVTYGYPNRCGDGDHDGWDVSCTAAGHGPAPASHAVHLALGAANGSSHYSYAQLERLWVSAGGPAWAAFSAASIAMCESGGNVYAHNGSGATGLFQILGQVVPGNLYDPYVNALNAVAKFKASGDSWAQWVCKP